MHDRTHLPLLPLILELAGARALASVIMRLNRRAELECYRGSRVSKVSTLVL